LARGSSQGGGNPEQCQSESVRAQGGDSSLLAGGVESDSDGQELMAIPNDLQDLITFAENMVYHIPTVPVVPLREAQEYAQRVQDKIWCDEADELLTRIEQVQWDYFGEGRESCKAFVDPYDLSNVRVALQALKDSLRGKDDL
jgi:hypothetical protein